MKNIISLCISILLFSGCFFSAHAEAQLGEDDIQHFINAMKPLRDLGEKYDITENNNLPTENTGFTAYFPMSRALENVKDHSSYEDFEKIIREAGFSSPAQWANIGDRVMRAYTSLKIIREMTPERIQEMLKGIEDVKKNKYLSPEIKEQILDSLTQTITMSDNISGNTKADQEALKPYLTRLERLFEE
ncbi:MAG: hypothetical protein COB49_03550 [Alphaproteobacteria bacterium]|nr:MAG: hypothetical protein COB49_03550 [Alphaproteobacteria bacterium]